MRETFEKNNCGRAGQLVGYLYGESAAAERADFERHLHDCAACRDELAAFTQVRGSVADFRAELLQAAPSVSLAELVTGSNAEPAAAPAENAAHASPLDGSGPRAAFTRFTPTASSAGAAWAALRAFFRLSPAWLRVSTAAAALAVCALALLAVLNAEVSLGDSRFALRTGVRHVASPAASAPAAPAPQSEELAALRTRLESLMAERDAAVRELEEARNELDDSRAANLVAAGFERAPSAQRGSPTPRDERRQRRAASVTSKSERSARGTRRLAEEEDLPRLLDLLGDAN